VEPAQDQKNSPIDPETTSSDASRNRHREAVEHYNRALDMQRKGFAYQAVLEYRAAVKAEDQMEEAWSNLGNVYADKQHYAEAIRSFQKAMTIRPDNPITLNGYGAALYRTGKTTQAMDLFRQALAMNPNLTAASNNLAKALEESGHHEEALQVLTKAGLIDKDGNYHKAPVPAYPGYGSGSGKSSTGSNVGDFGVRKPSCNSKHIHAQ
jgi:tetratricopeptide (TPR) repeat protein